MVPPHLRKRAEKLAPKDDRQPDADVMHDIPEDRLHGNQFPANPFPLANSWIPLQLTTNALAMTEAAGRANSDLANTPSATPITRTAIQQNTTDLAMAGSHPQLPSTSAPRFTDEQKTADRKKARHIVEASKNGKKGLSRYAAWRQFPKLYIDVPRDEQNVPLPSPPPAITSFDQVMAEAPPEMPAPVTQAAPPPPFALSAPPTPTPAATLDAGSRELVADIRQHIEDVLSRPDISLSQTILIVRELAKGVNVLAEQLGEEV
ncbi:hypothetical protein Slin14017_G057750 [Septoria linicola]|nr:hypothetical protein Slin14017_G057750 [Septoria linicola]